jgi:putative transposase
MAGKRFTPEQIITMLREAEVLLNQATPVVEVCRKLGISEQTYYRWRKEYGGMRVDQAKRLKELEQENARLKKLVADLSLDNAILKEANRGNFQARPKKAGLPSMSVKSWESPSGGPVRSWAGPGGICGWKIHSRAGTLIGGRSGRRGAI